MKTQQKIGGLAPLWMFFLMPVFAALADNCVECQKLFSQVTTEEASLRTYQDLKQKNEDYLKKTDIPSSALIKVQSNLVLINIKIETATNKIEAINNEKKKLNGCTGCEENPKTG